MTFSKGELSRSALNILVLDLNACVCHCPIKLWSTGIKCYWSQLQISVRPVLHAVPELALGPARAVMSRAIGAVMLVAARHFGGRTPFVWTWDSNFLGGQEAGGRLPLSVCIVYRSSVPFFLLQNYLERAVSSSVMEVFISALNTLFTVVPNMRDKFSKKLGMRMVWNHAQCC